MAHKVRLAPVGIVDLNRVLESKGPIGVQFTPISEFIARYTHTEIRCLPGSIEKAKSKLGAPFDRRGLKGLFFKLKNTHDKKAWFCSDLVAYASDEIHDDDAHLVTPERIYRLSTRLPK